MTIDDRPDEQPRVSDLCFGCGTDNPIGLHLSYDVDRDGSTFVTTTVSEQYSGEPGIVHGGIQATLLDEVMGRAVSRAVPPQDRHRPAVTATFQLRYRALCPTGTVLVARGRVDAIEWPSVRVLGTICDASGAVLTEAEARWRLLDAPATPRPRRHL